MSLDINCLQIASDVNACSTDAVAMGNFKEVGVLIPYSEIDKTSIVYNGCSVNFDLVAHGGAIKVYDRSFVPFDGTTTTEENKTRFKEYTDLVVFPLFNRDAENAHILSLFTNSKERWVFLVENEKVNSTGSNRFIVKGLTAGLTLKSEMVDVQNQAAYKIELQQINSVYPELFYFDTDNSTTIAKVDEMVSFDLIYGGTISNGGAVKLSVDTDKTGYIKLPNGTLLTTVAGVINTTYSGIGGNITYYIHKNSVNYDISASDLAGNVTVNICQPTVGISTLLSFGCGNITSLNIVNLRKALVYGSSSLSTLIMPHATDLIASSCALTAKSIGDIIYSAYVDNREDVIYDFSSGTNANQTAIAAYMLTTYGLDLSNVLEDLTSGLGGVITLNA